MPVVLKSLTITISCGTDNNILERKVSAHVSSGLAIHADLSNINNFAITHVASGRKVCEALTKDLARLLLTELLKLDAKWTRLVPWSSEAQARKLSRQVSTVSSALIES